MNKERLILDTDNKGNLKGLPKFPPNKKVEAIFLIIDKPDQKKPARRVPHKDIAGKIRIMGNISRTCGYGIHGSRDAIRKASVHIREK